MSKNILHKITLLQLGVTQRDVAKMLHFSESYVSMLVSGARQNDKFDKFIELLSSKDGNSEVIG